MPGRLPIDRPIWPRTVKLLQSLVSDISSSREMAERFLFLNRRGEPLTRFGVRYLLRVHLPKRLLGASDLNRRLDPH
jgi:integrase/recombinase XerD